MRIGTKSVLFGAHCFFLHPWFVAWAWWELYGFPWDPRLWVAFAVHDLGYFGKPNMDGEEGERHPWFGARVCSYLFATSIVLPSRFARTIGRVLDVLFGQDAYGTNWYSLLLYHSRFLAKQYGAPPSRFCMADKLAIALTPAWLYLPLVRVTGEIYEYMALAKKRNLVVGDPTAQGKYVSMNLGTANQKIWYADVRRYVRRWVEEHKDGREDTWTPDTKKAKTDSGVWE